MDSFESFKDAQKLAWAHFAPLEMFTTLVAARLVSHARVHAAQCILDVACGTGVVAVTAARIGARVTGLDLTSALLERARENSQIAGVEIDWREGDAEALPFQDGAFDVVMSQFGHIFAPRPEVAIGEMLRVLRPGGTIAFATWPPELFMGRMFTLIAGRKRRRFRSRDDARPRTQPSASTNESGKDTGTFNQARRDPVRDRSDKAGLVAPRI
jgi:SAM-dependent methyltransferase